MRTLLIGLDAACEEVLSPLFEEGSVPTLQGLFEDGSSGPLQSQVPPWTASAWPSLYTGTNPGKHGIFGFLSFDDYDFDIVDATQVQQPPLWELLDYHGLSSVVVNVPVTHPPRPFDGVLVPGYTAPNKPTCHPDGLLDDIERAVGDYRVYANDEGTDVADRDGQLAELAELAELRGATFEFLADRADPDFGFLQFQVTDTVCHQFPGDRDALRRVYRAVDDAIEGVLQACDPDTVCVASDHGIGPYEYRVAPNVALRDAGLVEETKGGNGMPTWASIRREDLRDSRPGSAERLLASAASLAARLGLTTQRVGRLFQRIGASDVVLSRAPDALVRAGSKQVAFEESEAYVRSRVECGVRLNVEGRESEGIVPRQEYDAVRQDVCEILERIETPDGEQVFEILGPREQFFHGPSVEDAVDVVAIPRNFNSYVTTWLTDEVVEPVDGPAWDHKRYGTFALAGEAVDDDHPVERAHLFDVAPTVLATMGVPTADRMDGEALPQVTPAGTDSYPDRTAVEVAGGATEAVENRLADLGYLE